jgi:FkbM family methyltransferase
MFTSIDIQNKPFVQIGASRGYDGFYEICRNNDPSKIILIEPHKSCHDFLKECYKDFGSKVYYEELAIVDDENITTAKLVDPYNTTEHCSIVPLKGWSLDRIIDVPATTITNIFKKYNLFDIGVLYIDTEGYDSRIINSIDFNTVNIKNIVYEAWHFSQDNFDEYHYLNGSDGMKYIKEKLESLNYDVNFFVDPKDNLSSYHATKK